MLVLPATATTTDTNQMTPTQFDALLRAITEGNSKLATRLERIERRQLEIQAAIVSLADHVGHPIVTVQADPAAGHPELTFADPLATLLDSDLETPDLADVQWSLADETPAFPEDEEVAEQPLPDGVLTPDRSPSHGMRWAYVGHGFDLPAFQGPKLDGETAYWRKAHGWVYSETTFQNSGPDYHYFLAVPA